MPRNTTTYRFRLPDGQVYGGHDTDDIFFAHPDATITHQTTWDDNGDENETVRLDPPLRYSEPDAEPDPDAVVEVSAEVEPETGDLLITVGDEPPHRVSVADRYERYLDGLTLEDDEPR